MKTFYDLFGVSRHATLADIGQSYRHYLNAYIARNGKRPLCQRERLHLKKMRDAYLVLAFPNRRQAYDRQLRLREQRLNQMRRRGVTTLAVISLLLGLGLIAGAPYMRARFGTHYAPEGAAMQHSAAPAAMASAYRQAQAGEQLNPASADSVSMQGRRPPT